jgi:hypothetical protein
MHLEDHPMGVSMKFLITAAVIAAVTASTPANAAYYFLTGNDLNEECQNAVTRAVCLGFVQGGMDELDAWRAYEHLPECFNAEITGGQAVDVVVKYFRDIPAQRDVFAAALVTSAVVQAWSPPHF